MKEFSPHRTVDVGLAHELIGVLVLQCFRVGTCSASSSQDQQPFRSPHRPDLIPFPHVPGSQFDSCRRTTATAAAVAIAT